MRSTRDVYQKLREVKYYHLIKLYRYFSRRVPENCKYHYPYVITSEKSDNIEIGLCTLHQPDMILNQGVYPHLLDVCYKIHHCTTCNAFILKYNKEDIKDIFDKELKNIKIKEKKYPDICALEWVLTRTIFEIPPISFIHKIFYYIKNIFSK